MTKKQPKRRSLSTALRQAIAASKLSGLELAKRSGVNQAQLCRFINGTRGLTLDSADKICQVLGLTLL